MAILRGVLPREAITPETNAGLGDSPFDNNPAREGEVPGWFVDGLGETYDPRRHGSFIFRAVHGQTGDIVFEVGVYEDEPVHWPEMPKDCELEVLWIRPEIELGEE